MKRAPVVISTYIRLGHLQKTITALLANVGAAETDVHVLSDGPRPGDERKVNEVREYLASVAGFRSLSVHARAVNNRVVNVRGGIREQLEINGELICLEEDIVTAPSFLNFMNQALERYRDHPGIFSICGYRPPFALPSDYHDDVFVLPRFSAWGFGIWKDRFEQLRMNIPRQEFYRFAMNPINLWKLSRGGVDMLYMLDAEVHEKIDALDVKIFYQQHLKGMFTVYPSVHLAANIGHDGTGMHCAATTRFDIELDNDPQRQFVLPEQPATNQSILDCNYDFRQDEKATLLKFPWQLLSSMRNFRRAN